MDYVLTCPCAPHFFNNNSATKWLDTINRYHVLILLIVCFCCCRHFTAKQWILNPSLYPFLVNIFRRYLIIQANWDVYVDVEWKRPRWFAVIYSTPQSSARQLLALRSRQQSIIKHRAERSWRLQKTTRKPWKI